MHSPQRAILPFVVASGLLPGLSGFAAAHEPTWAQFQATHQIGLAQDEVPRGPEDRLATLNLKLVDAETGRPLAGLVRVTNLETGTGIQLEEAIDRTQGWFSVPHETALRVPRTRLRVEAIHGIETQPVVSDVDLTATPQPVLQLRLPRIYDPAALGYASGNTHLHLRNLSHAGAVRYLEVVPASDGLDVVFLSHLRRAADERTYVSNAIVENSLEGGELARLSKNGRLFGNGEEHRHNFEAHDEGYGHVMLLNLKKLIRPVSIGPGIMGEGTDGIPLQRNILAARRDGGTAIWCHNHWGLEDVPNWLAGLLHANNIFDGGSQGSYEDSFYKYLNLGMRVPFSTGTDWFIYDFSRVYVPIGGDLTIRSWLAQLAAGRSYITNGTFLELQVGDDRVGDTISLESPEILHVQGRGLGRNDFGSLELVQNGQVVHAVPSRNAGRHFESNLDFRVSVTEPGWLALRIPRGSGKNELARELFAHTSPIYVEMAGRRIFREDVARELISEIEHNTIQIRSLGVYDEGELEAILAVHRQGIQTLRHRLGAAADRP